MLTAGDKLDRLALRGMTPPAKRMTGTVGRLFVWELRLTDTRVFGWCTEPGVFVGVLCGDATRLHSTEAKGPGSHDACARSVARWRTAAGFTQTDIWNGADLNAFLEPPNVPPI